MELTRRVANNGGQSDAFDYEFLGGMLINRGTNKDWVRVPISKQSSMTVYLAEWRYLRMSLFQVLSIIYLKITVPLLAPIVGLASPRNVPYDAGPIV